MGQIMRLRRLATNDHHIVDQNNGERHEAAFTGLIKDNGILWEAELLPRSYGGDSWFGKFHPAAGKELLSSLPVAFYGLLRRKMTLGGILKPHKLPKADLKAVQAIYEKIESREQRYELNLYITGEDEQPSRRRGALAAEAVSRSARTAPRPAPLTDPDASVGGQRAKAARSAPASGPRAETGRETRKPKGANQ